MLVLSMITVAAVVALRPPAAEPYLIKARQAFTPVIAANYSLSGSLAGLVPVGPAGAATASVQATIGAAQSAQKALRPLTPQSASDRQFAAAVTAALTSELAWLHATASVLTNPHSPMMGQLASLGVQTQQKFQALNATVPGAASSFPGSTRVISYARAENAAAATKKALARFSNQVQAMLRQSEPAYLQINQLFGQLAIAASGGVPTITLSQAEATINAVIANRSALAASARALDAPAPLAASARRALIAAMDASLANDQDINTCLNQANTGTVAFIFQSCLTSTAPDSQAATAAKQHFLTAYNRLRRSIGLPPTRQQF